MKKSDLDPIIGVIVSTVASIIILGVMLICFG